MICMYGNITGMWNDKWPKYNKLPKHTERQTASVCCGQVLWDSKHKSGFCKIAQIKIWQTRKWPLLLAQSETLSLASVLSLATLSDAGRRTAEHMAGHVSQRANGESCCAAI